MPVLEYATATSPHRGWSGWVAAVVVGAAAGFGVAQVAFEPVLRVLSRGAQYVVLDVVDEPFRKQAQFTLVMMLGGVLVGTSAVAATRLVGRNGGPAWALGFAAVFVCAASLGLLYARGTRPPAPPTGGFGGVPLLLGSAPALTAPLVGCAAVLLVLGGLALRCMTAARRAV